MIHHFIFFSLVIILWGCSTKEAGSDVNVRLHDIWALEFINSAEFVKGEQPVEQEAVLSGQGN